jgi:hypothetical protein
LLFIRVKKEREGYYHRGRVASRPRAACRTCLLCIFVLAVQGVYVLLVFRVLGERGIGKIQGNKPLLPLPLRVQGKKK